MGTCRGIPGPPIFMLKVKGGPRGYGVVIEVDVAGQYYIFNFWWRACGYLPFSFSWMRHLFIRHEKDIRISRSQLAHDHSLLCIKMLAVACVH